MSLEVVAMLSKVIYSSPDGGFVVAEFIDAKSAKRFRATGKTLTIGKNDSQQHYRLFGDWQATPKYGDTFQVVYSEPVRPDSLAGIIPFLVNNVKGVGDITARKFLETMDVRNMDELLVVCKEKRERVFEFFKAKRATAEAVLSVITGDEIYRSIMVFLHEHNIPPNFAKRIFERYGGEAINFLKENPYRLISDFRNVGFLRADAIAQKLGIELTSPFRLEAAFVYTLERAADDGHCCLPRDVLVENARSVLAGKQDKMFPFDFVLGELRSIYKKNKDAGDEKFVLRQLSSSNLAPPLAANKASMLFYLPEIYELENRVGGFCRALLNKEGVGTGHVEKEFQEAQGNVERLVPDIPWEKLSPEQRQAVENSIHTRMMVLTGGPGCGKTFVLRSIFRVQRALNRRVALCAPTGLAAKRMSLSVESQASTLHKMLRLGQKPTDANKRETSSEGGEGALDNVDVVIVDEASMLSLDLFHALLDAMTPDQRLILVGDVDQLPSVGAGNCLRDLIASEQVSVSRLTKIFRQSSESPIPLAAREIISGHKPEFSYTSRTHAFPKVEPFAFVPCSVQTFFSCLLPFLKETVPNIYGLNPMRDVQILVPMRRGEVGQENINKVLQAELNPPHPDKDECKIGFDGLLRVGDKVIQTRNNYDKDVFNGDLGFCKAIRKTSDKLEVDIAFDDKIVRLEDEEADDLQLCYAMTIHKSQGSEFSMCIIPQFSAYYTMLDRNLLYTAVTRASKTVLLMGEEWALKKSVNTQVSHKRFTALEALLRQG